MAQSDQRGTAERSETTRLSSDHVNDLTDTPDVNAPFGIMAHERGWVAAQSFIERKGYMLRPRFRPGWVGSWVGTGKDPKECEDSIPNVPGRTVLDAIRISDGMQVMLKLWTGSKSSTANEFPIHQYLTSTQLTSDPRNHTVPLIDYFPLTTPSGEQIKDYQMMVMPLFRDWNEPPFRMVAEAVSFIKQLLEGLEFMHSHNVAHRDIRSANVLMDARELIPGGFHGAFNLHEDRHNLPTKGRIRTRIEVPVKYYYIDFGLSTCFSSFEDRSLVTFQGGYFEDLPELKTDRSALYDPFQADIYALGWLLAGSFIGLRTGMEFTNDFFRDMLLDDPSARPTAPECVARFAKISEGLSSRQLLAPLGWRREEDQPPFLDLAAGYAKLLWHAAIHGIKRDT